MMKVNIASALIACFLTFTSLLWLMNDARNLGMVFALGSFLSCITPWDYFCYTEKWHTGAIFTVFCWFGLAIYLVEHEIVTLIAVALVGFYLGPDIAAVHELG